ncbi:E3 ubiquitin ligase PARAQUAT TOLERANCE 3-like [Henckelia pumila]|uniref:E3 ubiquitin ligase PARAQUAT TOLERANCE 3-like n=1 Tax=Henckelia pumila TaxID=405737 RepID=UPI003C6DDBC9
MSILYRFRSAVSFESMEVGDRASISVGELRAKILRGKVSQQGFDLFFSDAVSGLEYKGDDFQIPRGSSVIVRRLPCGAVPAALSPIETVNNIETRGSYTLNPAKEPINEFHDFGPDLFFMINANLPPSVQEIENNVMHKGMEDCTSLRRINLNFVHDLGTRAIGGHGSLKRIECVLFAIFFRVDGQCVHLLPFDLFRDLLFRLKNKVDLLLDRRNLDTNNLSEAVLRDSNQNGNEVNILLEARVEEQRKRSNNLPLELKCTLCKYYLKDAVMIRCCCHSFCENCIKQVLMEKGRCPKCFSVQCSIGDLIPNLSLRKVIRRFLEYQVLVSGLENHDLQKQVSDRESRIRGEGISYACTVVDRELEVPQSSTATGKGSNQVVGLCYEQQPQRNVPFADNVFEDVAPLATFQIENQLDIPQVKDRDEAYSSAKRREELWIDREGGDTNFLARGRHSEGIRACFTCGSPEHLTRDCPTCSTSNLTPLFQQGNEAFDGGMQTYRPLYGSNSMFSPIISYGNMYNNSGWVPFNASMPSVAPYAMPHYVSSMFGGSFVPSGNSRMVNMRPSHHTEFSRIRDRKNKQIRRSDENRPRGFIQLVRMVRLTMHVARDYPTSNLTPMFRQGLSVSL